MNNLLSSVITVIFSVFLTFGAIQYYESTQEFNYSKLNAATVEIRNPATSALGTGFWIAPNVVMTAAHVIRGHNDETPPFIESDDSNLRIPVKVIAENADMDIALITVSDADFARWKEHNEFATLQVEDYDELEAGMKVYALGHPDGQLYFLSEGIIGKLDANIYRGESPKDRKVNHISITNKVFRGNSGGPLVDESGKLIGVVNAIFGSGDYTNGFLSGLNENYPQVIPIRQAINALRDLHYYGKVNVERLGITANEELVITSVAEDAKLKIQVGDVLYAGENQHSGYTIFSRIDQTLAKMNEIGFNETYTITVLRNGQKVNLYGQSDTLEKITDTPFILD